MALPIPEATTPYGLSLVPAAFRGVLFAVTENSGAVGRRGQTHEYPFRDEPYDEDLGRRARRIAFKAFVIGDDAAAQRDQLIAALEQKGPGLLSHPNMGERMMAVDKTRPVTFVETWDKLRRIEFDLAFVEPGRDLYPTSNADSQAATNTAADGVGAAGDQDLADKTAPIGAGTASGAKAGGLVTGGGAAGVADSTNSQATQIASSDSFDATVRADPLREPLVSPTPSAADQELDTEIQGTMVVPF